MSNRFAIFMTAFLLFSCSKAPEPVTLKAAPKTPPHWSKDAIWYQIMVERFHNGDPSNDPTIANIQGTYLGYVPQTWETTPWTQNWYEPDSYFVDVYGQKNSNDRVIHSFDEKLSLRRYGGDLQGVLNKLDYLQSLGINALYFTPINDSPSFYKHDARFWHHIDVNFGPDPIGDNALIQSEDPSDPNTWHMTAADSLFLEVIQQAKARNMRIILNYSWHDTGEHFWAWRDVNSKQQASKYADWYSLQNSQGYGSKKNTATFLATTTSSDTSAKSSGLFSEGDLKSADAKSHIMAVTRRWLDPNGDGDPSDGVDGFKLSDAHALPLGFWRDYRIFVKSINPDTYLLAEMPAAESKDPLSDVQAVLRGDVFDGLVDNSWYKTAKHYFTKQPNFLAPSDLISALSSRAIVAAMSNSTDTDYINASVNTSANDEGPRLLSSLFNKNEYDVNTNAALNSTYKTHKPGATTMAIAKLLLLHQFTYVGAPHIRAGDEMGMWGPGYPHNSKPLIWPEYSFEDESGFGDDSSFGDNSADNNESAQNESKVNDEVRFNQALFEYYQFLVKLRRANSVLSSGNIEFVEQNKRKGLLSYRRYHDDAESVMALKNESVGANNAGANSSAETDNSDINLGTANTAIINNNETNDDAAHGDKIKTDSRSNNNINNRQSAYVVFNTSKKRQQTILPIEVVNAKSWLMWHSNQNTNILQSVPSEQLSIDAESAIVIIATH